MAGDLGKADDGLGRPERRGFFECRLCRHVGITVFISILLLEGAILFYFSRDFERERLLELERVNFAAIQSLFVGTSQATGDSGLLADATMLARATDIRGGALYRVAGGFIGVFGEAPETRIYDTMATAGDGRLLADKTRYEVKWRFSVAQPSLMMIARLDASQVKTAVAKFFWRILALVGVISVIVTAVTMAILSRLTLAPVLALRQSLLAAGDDPASPERHKITPERADELGEAFEAFNRMLDRLAESNREIKQRQIELHRVNTNLERIVDARTTSLRDSNRKLSDEIVERRQMEKQVERLAYFDALTGLPNRTLFYDRVHRILDWSRTSPRFAILLIDLDNFKDVNDCLGHAVGDDLLKVVATRLSTCVRVSDTVARLGGDEFIICQTGVTGPRDAATLAMHIIDSLSQPYFLEGHSIHSRISIGIAMSPADGRTHEHLLRNADLALYRAKEEGRGSYCFFVDEMHAQVERRRGIERDLRNALEMGEFNLLFEPQIDLCYDRIDGLEALVRWQHPEKGELFPSEFIPVAERSGLIISIGVWILREACIRAKALQVAGLRPIPVAVNISTVQLKQANFPEMVAAALNETGLAPEYLNIEITESSLMDNPEAVTTNLDHMKRMGVRVIIDDFGTGYSSFSLLKQLPVGGIKIDRSFICDLTTDKDSAAIVRATVMLGQALSLTVIAEGLETQDQERFLTECGCHRAQGKIFGGPLSWEELNSILRFLERSHLEQSPKVDNPPALVVHDNMGKPKMKRIGQ